jgi:hypothetical protein
LIFIHDEYQKILLAPKARVNPNQRAERGRSIVPKSFGMNRYLNQVFQGLFKERPHPIRPLTIISIDELEQILPYTARGIITWQELFNSRFQGDEVRPFSVHQAFYDIQRDLPIEPIRNEFLLQRFDEIWSRIQNQCARLRCDQ